MTIADILRAGKANIETKGWVQGDEEAFDGKNGCCVGTSVSGRNLPGEFDLERSLDALRLFKIANGIDLDLGVGDWNDFPARTKEEVLTAFDKAIALAEQENT